MDNNNDLHCLYYKNTAYLQKSMNYFIICFVNCLDVPSRLRRIQCNNDTSDFFMRFCFAFLSFFFVFCIRILFILWQNYNEVEIFSELKLFCSLNTYKYNFVRMLWDKEYDERHFLSTKNFNFILMNSSFNFHFLQ